MASSPASSGVAGLGMGQAVGAAAAGPAGGATALTIRDLATSSPLQLSTKSTEALTKILATVPPDTVAVTVTATDANGGEIGVAVAARIGEQWSVGCVFDRKRQRPTEVGFQLQYKF